MHPTDYTFKLYDKNQDFSKSIASKKMTPYNYWLDNKVNIFSQQFNFHRPSIYDLKSDEDDTSFVSSSQKATQHNTYVTFLKNIKNRKITFSPTTNTHHHIL